MNENGLFDQMEFLIGPSVSLYLSLVLTDGRMDILFDQRELLTGKIVILSLPEYVFNSNMIFLEYFHLTILFTRL